MAIFIKILQFFMSLGLLVLVHEFGHFISAVAFKIRVEKFYIFFNPSFSIMRCKKIDGKWRFKFFAKNVPEKYETIETRNLAGKKEVTYKPIPLDTLPKDDWRLYDGTEYGIGWLPLGGFCKIAGMIDESMDKAQMSMAPQEWEFRSKPAWQRFVVMIAGVCMNIITAMLIYIGVMSHYGEQYLSTAEVNKYGITADSLAQTYGLRDGDKILTVNGKQIDNFNRITTELIFDGAEQIEVERDGEPMAIDLPKDAYAKIFIDVNENKNEFIGLRSPFIAGGFTDDSPAHKAGLAEGDVIIGFDEVPTPYFNDFSVEIRKHKNETVNLNIVRQSDTLTLPVTLTNEGVIGVYPMYPFEMSTFEYTFWEAIPKGISKTFSMMADYVKQFKIVFSKEAKGYKSLGGFITIGSVFSGTFDWQRFWFMTAFLSIALAVVNIIPIPGLDGGHALMPVVEVITRRKPSDRFLEITQAIGLIIIIALIVLANGNDIIRLLK